jgi:DNA-binding NtrC family response regulator
MRKPSIVLLDADEHSKVLLLQHGFDVHGLSDSGDLIRSFRHRPPDIVIVGGSGDATRDELEIAQHVRRWHRSVPLLLLTARSSEERAITALRAGVSDYLKHPVSPEELVASVYRCLAGTRAGTPTGPLRTAADRLPMDAMVGDSRAMREVRARISKVAATDSTVLITGETGTGKELAAGLIHRGSRRRQHPLTCINCAAIPDSLVESELFGYERGAFTGAHAAHEGQLQLAGGGTVLLDEIGDMTPYAQAKLLRAIETRVVHRLGGSRSETLDIRVIAATNQDLDRLVTEGRFRKDLYYRLKVVQIHMPPLRERRQDIGPLVEHCVQELNARLGTGITGVTSDALDDLVSHDWPGNVRELKNLLEGLAVDVPAGAICRRDLPPELRGLSRVPGTTPDAEDEASERERVLSALLHANWNKCRAAEHLRWSRMTLYRKIAKYQITTGGAGQAQGGAAVTARHAVTDG